MSGVSANAIETLREKADLFVIPGFRDEDGVWHDGPHRVEFDAALAAMEALLEAAANAVYSTLAVLPLDGSGNTGYRAKPTSQTTTVALPEEWNDAAEAIAALDAARRRVETGR